MGRVALRRMISRTCLAVSLLLLSLSPMAWGQSADSGTFKITQTNPIISTSTISGNESYKVAGSGQGFIINSNLWVAEGETPVLSAVEESLSPDWTLERYTFNGVVGGIKQKIEAWVDGGKVHMQFTAEGANPQRTVDLRPNTVVLDNFVPTNFQVLLNQFAGSSAARSGANTEDVYLLVPQKLMAVKATFARAGTDQAILLGKQVEVTKYTLRTPSVAAQVWADDQNHVLGVYFDASDIEYLHSGFDLPQLRAATARRLPREQPVSFSSNDRQLLGTLMLPPESLEKKAPYPVVVMAGGFGPLDRDGTIGRNKPLRDLALGLANKGIATLRYDKPTYSFHGRLDLSRLTVDNEAIDAAVDAVRYAHTLREVDPANIFVLGHSEGAEIAPFILQRAPEVRGAVLMASPARPADQFVPEQLAADLRMKGTPADQIEAQVTAARKEFAEIRAGSMPDASLVLGYPAGFWRSLFACDSLQALRQIRKPVLLLQGSRDLQLSQEDYERIRGTVPADELEAEYFTGLNHIFMPAAEGSNGSEMLIGSHIPDPVIGRITAWIDHHVSGQVPEKDISTRASAKE